MRLAARNAKCLVGALAVLLFGAVASIAWAQDTQEPAAPTRDVDAEARDEARRAFRESLSEVSADSRRRAQLEQARRLAPFNLDWGLR